MDENLITPSDYFQRGMELLETGKFREALEHFEAAVDRHYFDSDIHLPMGEALFEVGRYNDALDHFGKVEAEDTNGQVDVLLWRGSCYLELRKTRRAISAFNRVLELQPENAEAHFKRGLALADMGSPDRALEAFSQSEALLRKGSGGDTQALAEVLMWKGRVLSRLGRRQEGLGLMFQAWETAPDHPGPYNEIADSFRLSGDLVSAEEWYLKGIERLPAEPSLHNDYGNLLRELGRLRDSLNHLTTAIEHDANRTVAYYNRALTLEKLELYDEALKDYDTVIDNNLQDVDARLRKIDLLAQMRMFKDAHSLLLELTEAERREPAAIETAARLYNREAAAAEAAGDWPLALRMHRMVLEQHPDYLDVESPTGPDDVPIRRMIALDEAMKGFTRKAEFRGLANLLQGAVRYGIRRFEGGRGMRPDSDETRKELDKIRRPLRNALQAKAWPELCHKLLAEVEFYEAGNAQEASAEVSRALEIKPDFVGALWLKAAIVGDGLGKRQEAVGCYKRILEISPDNPAVLLNLGDLYLDFGQPHRALACYRAVLEERPGDISVNRDIGHCYLALQRYGDAISTFARMDTEGELGLEIQLDLAEAHLAVGDRAEAAKLIDVVRASSFSLDPQLDARAAELAASLALGRRNPRHALRELKKVKETQLSSFGLLVRARANLELKHLADAAEDLAEIMQMLDPHSSDWHDALYHSARLAFVSGGTDSSLELLGRLLEASPLDERAFRLKAWILKLEGRADEYEETEQQRKFAAEIAKIHRLLQYEDFQEALQAAEALAQDHPTRPEPEYYRACTLAQIGEEDAAMEVVRRLATDAQVRRRMLDEFYLDTLKLAGRPEFRA